MKRQTDSEISWPSSGKKPRTGLHTNFKTLEWTAEGVVLLDQRKLPREETSLLCKTYQEVAEGIRSMVVRGAPAIGVAAAMGVALGIKNSTAPTLEKLAEELETISKTLLETRPTAVNLPWALKRMRKVFDRVRASVNGSETEKLQVIRKTLEEEACRIHAEDIAICETIGRNGAQLIENSSSILTHCNAGALATGGYGTALGVVRAAVGEGKKVHVFADETRPFLQGARLTVWELQKDKIPVTLITDNMAGHLMKRGEIQGVVVGADRIASNGDVANKIGTYTVAVLAKENGIPFYVAAPLSTIDMSIDSGDQIPIEERSPEEVKQIEGVALAPEGTEARHPAFDVTPSRYVTAIITERGVAREPYRESFKRMFAERS